MEVMFPLLVAMCTVLQLSSASAFGSTSTKSCEEARLKCAYRTGCGMALQNYIVGCSAVIYGPTASCPEQCQHALIALISTEEGKDLMNCNCNDEFCEETKQRVEVCRPHVVNATLDETVVSCKVAQWICAADALCSTALEYYHRLCKSMFKGKKCSYRCNNSISILRRQEKAAKLNTCRCDDREDFGKHYDCQKIQTNMARLCFQKESDPDPGERDSVDVSSTKLPPKSTGTYHLPPHLTLLAVLAVASRTISQCSM